MSNSKKLRLLTAVASLTLLPGMLLASPSDDDRGRRGRDRDRRVERRAENRAEIRRATRRHAPRVVVCDDHRSHRHNGRSNRACGCVEVLRKGYYKTVVEHVRTPGHYERVWVPAKRLRFGRHVNVSFCGGHYERVWVPGEVRRVERQVYVPAQRVIEKRCRKHRH